MPTAGDYRRRGRGAGGRYLILYLKRLHKFAVFDVSVAKVVQYLQSPADDFLLTASADTLIAVLPKKKVMERWSLQTFEKEATASLSVDFQIAQIAVGNNSTGPLLLWGEQNGGALINLATLKKSPLAAANSPGGGRPYVVHVEAAPDGSAFTFWPRRQVCPSGVLYDDSS